MVEQIFRLIFDWIVMVEAAGFLTKYHSYLVGAVGEDVRLEG